MIINARPTFWATGYTKDEHLHRVSTRVRAEEVMEYPGDKGGARIWVKPRHLGPVKDGDYVDVLDDIAVIPELKKRPKVKVIAMAQFHYDYLKKELPNEITLIYHHHINFERIRRIRNKELLGGMIGTPSKKTYDLVDEIKNKLNFETCFNYRTRTDMVDYYKKIDYLVIWYFGARDTYYVHPTKIINAASFGIPSLAIPLKGYSEVEGLYIPIESVDDIEKEVEKLKDEKYYQEFSDKIYQEAEKYHISNTTKEYERLDDYIHDL